MVKISNSVLIATLAVSGALGLTNCSKTCNQQVTSVSSVQNTTGRNLTLSVCVAGIAQTQSVQVPADQNAEMAVETHARKTAITGNPKYQCMEQQQDAAVYLTSDSFSDVKFCHNLTYIDAPMQIVEKSKTCPTGYSEQIAAVDDCATLEGRASLGGGAHTTNTNKTKSNR